MSISKYHVSKNLCNISTYTASGQGSKYEYFGNVTLSAGTYTFSCRQNDILSSATRNTLFVVIDSNFAYENTTTNYHLNEGLHSLTFTLESKKTIMLGYWTNAISNDCVYDEFMLNTGSQPLPYEPYGNTWNSIPYRKYGTETDTLTSLPADVIADGQSASANIIGNMEQTGTPSPSSIIMPDECGNKTANLFNVAELTWNSGILDDNGQPQSSTASHYTGNYIAVEPNTNYYFSGTLMSGSTAYRFYYYDSAKQWISRNQGGSRTFTTPANCYYMQVQCSLNISAPTDWCLVEGSTAPSTYIPYGYEIPILSGGVTTPVYLGQVQSTRQIYDLVLTGNENWQRTDNCFRLVINGIKPENEVVCSHFIKNSAYNLRNGGTGIANYADFYGTSYRGIYIRDDTITTSTEDFKTYLQQQYAAGTPVTVWYVLATPTTGIVNEPIRKIGNYADSVAVSGIPTTGTAEQFDVDTTLNPSEVDLTYHGWHEHSDTKFTT